MTQANNTGREQPKKHPRVGGYELIAKLGRGAVGIVYKARQLSVGRVVALKLLDPKYTRDEKYVGRFLREAQSAANLNHVNIVQGIDAGKAPEGYHYFAMEYVEGETLKELMVRDGAIAEARAIDIVSQIAQALRHAEKIKLVHRDIKPENIMLTKEGIAKLADLGLAKSVIEDGSITLAGQAMGTPLYISPEQAQGKDTVDVRSDIYSLGATLYHMTTGFAPFAGENPTVIMLKHINEEARSPREINPDLSEGLCHLIAKMMAKDQAGRYQTATELLDDLSALAAGQAPGLAGEHALRKTATAPAPSAQQPQSRRFPALLVAGALILAAAAGSYFAFFYEPASQPRPPLRPDPGVMQRQREKQARDRYSDARQREEEGALADAQTAYEYLVANYADTPAAADAAERIEAIKKRLVERSLLETDEAAYDQLVKKVEAAKTEKAHGRAIELVKAFGAGDHHEQVAKKVESLLQSLREELKPIAENMHGKTLKLIDGGQYEEAKRTLAELNNLGYTVWYRQGLAKIDAEIKENTERAAKAHAAFWLRFAATLRQEGIDAADAFVNQALEAPEFSAAKTEIEWDRQLLEHLEQIDRDALDGLRALDGKKFPLDGKNLISIRNVTDTTFDKIISGEPISVTFDSLKPEERFRLAQHCWKINASQGAAPSAVYYLCVAFDLDAARKDARALPEEDARRLVLRIDLLTPEARALELLDNAATAGKKRNWEEARAACEQLREQYGDTLTVRENRDTIDGLYRKAELERFALAIPKKFKADIQLLRDGRWKFHWDFSTKDQLKDFEHATHVYIDSAEKPAVSDGALVLKGIDVIVPVIFKDAPLTIEYKLNLREEKAAHGYGRVLIFPVTRKGPSDQWEFAYCHGDQRNKDAPDFFRNTYTLGREVDNCWRRPYPGGKTPRNTWHRVKIEITESSAKAKFRDWPAYDSARVKFPAGGELDPAALPDLSRPYQVQFSGWQPDDTWAFDDITITGTIDIEWLRAAAGEQRP